MADEENRSDVIGFRLESEDKDRLKRFMEQEGKGNKGFMQVLLNLYELNKGKIKNINLVGDIDELEKYTTKIQQTFINMIEKLEGQKEGIAEEKNKDLLLYKEKINCLINENDELKLDNSLFKVTLNNVTSDNMALNSQYDKLHKGMKEKIEQLQKRLQDKARIIEEYKGKNDILLSQLKQYEKYAEELKETKTLLTNEQGKNIESEKILNEKTSVITNLADDIQNLNDNHKSGIDKVKGNCAQDIDRIKEKATFDKEKVLLTKDKEYQELLNKVNREYASKI